MDTRQTHRRTHESLQSRGFPCIGVGQDTPHGRQEPQLSWKATAWAKETRGHRGHAQKLLLMVLADYHDDERGYAWPSQKRLSDDCEMPIRTVKWCIAKLESDGFITTLQKGNQYQPSQYRLNLNTLIALSQAHEGAISESAMVAPTSEGAVIRKVKGQYRASEGVAPRITNLQEPPIEPPHIIRWVEIFLQNSQKFAYPPEKWISTIEAEYNTKLNLELEALSCAEWLRTDTKGRGRVDFKQTFHNWLKRSSNNNQSNGHTPLTRDNNTPPFLQAMIDADPHQEQHLRDAHKLGQL